MKDPKFYICERCGNIVEIIEASGVTPVCCGQKMTELVAGTVDASREKHIPVVSVNGDTVEVVVGSVEHPMSEEHHISWIYLQTDRGVYRRDLPHTGEPRATFTLTDEKPIAVYEYCNLHGLWKTEIQ